MARTIKSENFTYQENMPLWVLLYTDETGYHSRIYFAEAATEELARNVVEDDTLPEDLVFQACVELYVVLQDISMAPHEDVYESKKGQLANELFSFLRPNDRKEDQG